MAEQRGPEPIVCVGGWWPPGEGEPGKDWFPEDATLRLEVDPHGQDFNVLMLTPDGERALCWVPFEGVLAAVMHSPREKAPDG